MKIIDQNEQETLLLEFMGKRNGGWWLELVNRKTGHAQIITHQDKGFFEGLNLTHCKQIFKRVEPVTMYKAGKV